MQPFLAETNHNVVATNRHLFPASVPLSCRVSLFDPIAPWRLTQSAGREWIGRC